MAVQDPSYPVIHICVVGYNYCYASICKKWSLRFCCYYYISLFY